MAPPKAILFDIGGVCVVSPFQAIVDYEKENNISSGWINFAISHSAPNGYWQRLERGEIKLDDAFFEGFSDDLHNAEAWMAFNKQPKNGKRRLKDLANPSQLGDPISLKAETADSAPTDQDRGAQSSKSSSKQASSRRSDSSRESGSSKSLKELAEENPTRLGDPVSLKAEAADSEPTDQDRGAQSSQASSKQDSSRGSSSHKSLKELATENPTLLGDPVSLKAEAADSEPTDQDRGASSPTSQTTPPATQSSPLSAPSLPPIAATPLFWSMMTISRTPDPHMLPYLTHLASLSPRPFLLGALSNTITFPASHPFTAAYSAASTLRSLFDVFVASAEVGLRKPHRAIYELVLRQLDARDRERGGSGVTAGEVLFLDDIGENLRMGREVGMRTLRVLLGRSEEAVRELEEITGVRAGREGARGPKL